MLISYIQSIMMIILEVICCKIFFESFAEKRSKNNYRNYSINKKVLKVVEHVMRNEAVYGIDRFPPACMGIFHQPKRPIIQKKSER